MRHISKFEFRNILFLTHQNYGQTPNAMQAPTTQTDSSLFQAGKPWQLGSQTAHSAAPNSEITYRQAGHSAKDGFLITLLHLAFPATSCHPLYW